MPKSLIFGERGFAGSYLRQHLEAEGQTVHGFSLRDGCDIRSYEQVRTALEVSRPDYVYVLAAQAYVPEASYDPERAFDVNVMGFHNVLKAIQHTGSSARVHFASTSEAVGYNCDTHDEQTLPEPATPYGISKLSAEHLGLFYSRVYGIPVSITRAFNHSGPGHAPTYAVPSFAKRVAEVMAGKSSEVVHGNLEAVRSYADVRDIVRAYRLAVDLPSGIYNVGSERAVSMQWVLDKLIELSGQDIPTRLDESLYRPGSSYFPKISCEKFRDATGWAPEYKLETTLADVLAYWREQT